MKSMLFKMLGLAVVAAALALFGGYGIGYDMKAQAAPGPNGHSVRNVPQGFRFGMPRGLQFSGVQAPARRGGEMYRFGRPGASHHRALQPRVAGRAW